MADDADDWDDPDDAPAFPAAVSLAGWLWAGQGAVILALGVGLLTRAIYVGAEAFTCPSAFLTAAGCQYLGYGRRVILGRADGVGGFGARSAGVAAIVAAVGGVIGGFTTDPGARLVGTAVVGAGLALAVPGVLALGGRRQYLAWREYHHPGNPPDT